jgi:peptidoglycan/LPS O-acetylase OafA/YrhL
MQCRNCGAEIADKAIVCYRCGAAITDPVRRPVALKPRRSQLVSLVALMALVLLALYLGQASRTAANSEYFRLAAGLCVGAAIAILLLRILRRR